MVHVEGRTINRRRLTLETELCSPTSTVWGGGCDLEKKIRGPGQRGKTTLELGERVRRCCARQPARRRHRRRRRALSRRSVC